MEKTVFTNTYVFKLLGIKLFEFKSDYVGYEIKQKENPDTVTPADYIILKDFIERERKKENKKPKKKDK